MQSGTVLKTDYFLGTSKIPKGGGGGGIITSYIPRALTSEILGNKGEK